VGFGSEFCEMTKGLCLHFSPKLPTKMQNQSDDDLYSRVFLELLEKIQASMIPGLLDSTIKGTIHSQYKFLLTLQCVMTFQASKITSFWVMFTFQKVSFSVNG
jgi:hypothetical protein